MKPRVRTPAATLACLVALCAALMFANYGMQQVHMLKDAGAVQTAGSSGAQALALIEQQSPDAVLLDFLMPGMDGPELCVRIRSLPLQRRLPLIVLSGMDDPQARKAAHAAGADDFVVKPFDRADLRDRLAALLRS